MTTLRRRTLVDRANLIFLKQLVKTKEGRAYLLAQVADTETSGEGGVFDQLQTLMADDPDLRRLSARHAADEEQHAARLNARIAQLNVARPVIPARLNVLFGLDARVHVFDHPLATREDVMRAYLFLQVLEERVVWQFDLFIAALRTADAVSADLFGDIVKDEARHLKYCHAISRRYASSEAVREATLAVFRRAESEAFAENGVDSLLYVLDQGLLDEPKWVQRVWRFLATWSRPPARTALPASLTPASGPAPTTDRSYAPTPSLIQAPAPKPVCG